MVKVGKAGWVERVILAARDYGIHTVLFRHVVGERLGVNVTDMECLALLFHKGLASPSELAAYTGLTSGATTAMLDRLERGGLIARRRNPKDRRGALIVLVKSGTRKVGPWFASVRKAQDALVSGYSEKDLRLIANFLERSSRMWDEQRRQLQREISPK